MQIKDIVVGRKYFAKESGEEKTRWITVGRLFIKDDGKMAIKFEDFVNPLAFRNEKGDVWFNVFEQKKNENSPKNAQKKEYYTEPTEEEKDRIQSEGKAYAEKWKKQAESQVVGEYPESEETIIDEVPF